jgi:hypothetical protein
VAKKLAGCIKKIHKKQKIGKKHFIFHCFLFSGISVLTVYADERDQSYKNAMKHQQNGSKSMYFG